MGNGYETRRNCSPDVAASQLQGKYYLIGKSGYEDGKTTDHSHEPTSLLNTLCVARGNGDGSGHDAAGLSLRSAETQCAAVNDSRRLRECSGTGKTRRRALS